MYLSIPYQSRLDVSPVRGRDGVWGRSCSKEKLLAKIKTKDKRFNRETSPSENSSRRKWTRATYREFFVFVSSCFCFVLFFSFFCLVFVYCYFLSLFILWNILKFPVRCLLKIFNYWKNSGKTWKTCCKEKTFVENPAKATENHYRF